ncbi:UvrD-helicase domain-containing protein [Kribbella italica]|uniref:Superfamily I DNA/RNA helicase n=1 Tax=Kribbella italica TaxID=1540520 RepID=A0A7W9J931_9ACTN|nr:UvrD-helicase domain-containing protein [Kribbella italica]MBB5837803.1 superfamily I DNA/RNA helicase [Kribbella italica]
MNSLRTFQICGLQISEAGTQILDNHPEIVTTKISGVTYLIHHQDTLESRRVVFAGDLPETFHAAGVSPTHEQQVLERVIAFVERSQHTPLLLPSQWSQYKHNDFIAFFACRRDLIIDAPRWIAQVPTGLDPDVYMWLLTSSSKKVTLEDFAPVPGLQMSVEQNWATAVDMMKTARASAKPTVQDVAEMDLTSSAFSDVVQDLSYSGWMTRITGQQHTFIHQPPNHSIRLRGPAGSGKTLTLVLKAIREVVEARERGESIQVLFVTHSWALAAEVDDNIRRLSEWGPLDEITVLPLLAVAEDLLPAERWDSGLTLIGEDSYSGKMAQLDEIEEIIDNFKRGDWITFSDDVGPGLRERLLSSDEADLRAFAWDCLIEFGCVLGADGIFPGMNSEARYLKLSRDPWMIPLENDIDRKLIYHLYETYITQLLESGRLTSDQLVNDFLNYLETFMWNVRRGKQGYDLIFVDEFHLFNVQERQLLRYLARSASAYPRILMALDPRQSPWEVYTEFNGATPSSTPSKSDDEFGTVSSVDLPTVHRFSPEILDLVKHLHWEFPNLDLGSNWDVDFTHVNSSAEHGALPKLIRSGSQQAEIVEIYQALRALRNGDSNRWQVALAIVHPDQFLAYKNVADGLQSATKKVTIIESREDIEVLQYRRRGLVIGPAEYLAGLQFDAVFVAGLPEIGNGQANQSYRRRQFLSLLYLAVTRASRDVHIFVNDDHGGVPEVLAKAKDQELLDYIEGSQV